jgi:plastocyanin
MAFCSKLLTTQGSAKIGSSLSGYDRSKLEASRCFAILMGLVVAVPAATTITVIQRGLALNMASASLAKGDRLNFTNDDDVIHNIYIFSPGSEDSADLGLQKPGKLLSYNSTRPTPTGSAATSMAVTVK